jgi:hypothetical protein
MNGAITSQNFPAKRHILKDIKDTLKGILKGILKDIPITKDPILNKIKTKSLNS